MRKNMKKVVVLLLAVALIPASLFAVDGQVLINQSTLNAAGGTYTITQAGSYKLSGNLQVKDADTTPIVVSADNVTIDLNGFTIGGANVCGLTCRFTSAQNGIDSVFGINLTVTNGTINGMGQFGIHAEGLGMRIDSVTVSNNGFDGMRVGSGLIDKCRVLRNGRWGISTTSEGGSVQRSFIDQNKLFGMVLGPQWGYFQNNLQNNNGLVNQQESAYGLN